LIIQIHIHQLYKQTVFRITIAIATRYHWNLKQLDIKTAYLNEKLKEKIYMKIPKGDKNYNKGKYWLLEKALKTSW